MDKTCKISKTPKMREDLLGQSKGFRVGDMLHSTVLRLFPQLLSHVVGRILRMTFIVPHSCVVLSSLSVGDTYKYLITPIDYVVMRASSKHVISLKAEHFIWLVAEASSDHEKNSACCSCL